MFLELVKLIELVDSGGVEHDVGHRVKHPVEHLQLHGADRELRGDPERRL